MNLYLRALKNTQICVTGRAPPRAARLGFPFPLYGQPDGVHPLCPCAFHHGQNRPGGRREDDTLRALPHDSVSCPGATTSYVSSTTSAATSKNKSLPGNSPLFAHARPLGRGQPPEKGLLPHCKSGKFNVPLRYNAKKQQP